MRKTLLMTLLGISCLCVAATSRAEFRVASVTTDGIYDLYFMRCGPGWTGGDGTYSVRLPSGQIAWLSSDSFIGRVDANGRRQYPHASSAFVLGNVINIQPTTGIFTTYLKQYGATEARPSYAMYPHDDQNCPPASYAVPWGSEALIKPSSCPAADRRCWYWMGDGVVESASNGQQLRTFVRKFEQWDIDGDKEFEALEFRWIGTDIASIPAASLTTSPVITSAPFLSLVMYGSAILKDGAYTYIYGVRRENGSRCQGQCVHVARVPNDKLTTLSEWRYYGQDPSGSFGWFSNGGYSVPLNGVNGTLGPEVGEEFSVAKYQSCGALATCYVLIAHASGIDKREIRAFQGASPVGPWSAPAHVYDTPEPGTYNSHAHPWSVTQDGMLVSYNINRSDYTYASNYRPRFIRVKFAW